MSERNIVSLIDRRIADIMRVAVELEAQADMLRDFARINERKAAELYDQAELLRAEVGGWRPESRSG